MGHPLSFPQSYIRVSAVVLECGEGQTHRQTDTQTAVITVRYKTRPHTFSRNFAKYSPIFTIILSLTDSLVNLQQSLIRYPITPYKRHYTTLRNITYHSSKIVVLLD